MPAAIHTGQSDLCLAATGRLIEPRGEVAFFPWLAARAFDRTALVVPALIETTLTTPLARGNDRSNTQAFAMIPERFAVMSRPGQDTSAAFAAYLWYLATTPFRAGG